MTRSLTAPTKAAIISAMAEVGNIRQAVDKVRASGLSMIHRTTVRSWLKTDPQFKEDYDEAQEDFADMLEGIVMDRIRSPQGVRGSDALLMFSLNGRRSHVYRPAGAVDTSDSRSALAGIRVKLKELKGDLTVEVIAGNGAVSQVDPPTNSAEHSGISDRRESSE